MKRIVLAFFLAVLTISVRAAEFAPDNDGFIRNWLLLAPIPLPDGSSGGEEIDKEQIKEEAKLSPKEGDTAKAGDKTLTWKSINATDYFFDVNVVLGAQTEDSCAYAVCYVVADADLKDVVLQMGSNDEGKVYLNGKEVVKFTETRVVDKDQNAAKDLTLNKGVNKLVFKVINEKNNWQGCIRFTTKDGKPVKDVKIKLEP